jgi:hypothetical protein
MKTSLEVAREETRHARANAERAREAAARAEELVDPGAAVPSGLVAMAVAAAHSASVAATAASEAAANALAVAESEAQPAPTPAFQKACLAVSEALRAAVEAAQAATAALGIASTLPDLDAAASERLKGGPAASSDKRCAFCGMTESATRLAAGPQVYICEECVKQCARVLGLKIP